MSASQDRDSGRQPRTGLVNPALGYQNHRKVDVESGKTTVVRDTRGPLNVNASPWAEVIDGTRSA